MDHPLWGRLYAAGIAIAAAAVLVTAMRIHPDGHGVGTHTQLGLSTCPFLMMTALPCPTCGMTTAFAYTVRGQWLSAIRAQAAGFVLALATVAACLLGAVAAITGRRPAVNWYRVSPLKTVFWCTGLLVAAWAVKIVLALVDGTASAR